MPDSKKVGAIMFTNGLEILMLRKKPGGENGGKFALPGGKGKSGESKWETAVRETKEETGIKEIPGKIIGEFACKKDNIDFTCFVMKIEDKFDVILSKEHTDYKWINCRSIKNSPEIHPRLKEKLNDYIEIILKEFKGSDVWNSALKAKFGF